MADDNLKTIEEYLARAFRCLKAGDCDGAIKDYTEVLKQKPDNSHALVNRGAARAPLLTVVVDHQGGGSSCRLSTPKNFISDKHRQLIHTIIMNSDITASTYVI